VAAGASVAGASVGAGDPQAASTKDRIKPMNKSNFIERDILLFSFFKFIAFRSNFTRDKADMIIRPRQP
jgi:hypothetical protein